MNVQSVIQEPFPGLRPFKTCEDYLFFGRDEHVYTMVDRLEATRFLTVIGVSGSGKSSLVNCGLRPALHRGYMSSADADWHIATCRPGSDPIGNLVKAVREDIGLELDDVLLRNTEVNEAGLMKALEGAYKSSSIKGGNILLIVDQFEEIFRYMAEGVVEKEEAHRFIQLLLEVRQQRTYPVYFTMSMRSDFLGECAHFDGLPQAINEGMFLIPRLTQVERRAVIRGPIKVVDPEIEIEEALLTQLATELGEKPDQLTILQHALNRTWHYWKKAGGTGPVEIGHYKTAGKMTGAIDQHATDIYQSLDSSRAQTICRVLFQALTERGSDGRGIRRPRQFSDLCTLANAMIQASSKTATPVTREEVCAVIEPFWRQGVNFIYVSTDNLDTCDDDEGAKLELNGDTFVDISHENLMEHWTALKEWVDEETESAIKYDELLKKAHKHKESGGGYLQDPELQVTLDWWKRTALSSEWADRYGGHFELADTFLFQSEKQREKERAEKERMRLKEARYKRTRIYLFAVIPLAVIAIVLALLGLNSADKAKRSAAIADSLRIESENLRKLAEAAAEVAIESRKEAQDSAKIANSQKKLSEAERDAGVQLIESIGWHMDSVWAKIKDNYEFNLDQDFVRIEPDSFRMGFETGRDNETPVHTVTISECYYIGKKEVTQGQWYAVMGTRPSHFIGKDRPLENVRWDDIEEFITRLNNKEKDASCNNCYRLPTEAQWEYAARAGSTTSYSFGDDSLRLDIYAWYGENASGETHNVGLKRPNAWGLYDMHGNVWEWVQDWYDFYSQESVIDPTGPDERIHRVIRGGGLRNEKEELRSAYRDEANPEVPDPHIGFRLARTCP